MKRVFSMVCPVIREDPGTSVEDLVVGYQMAKIALLSYDASGFRSDEIITRVEMYNNRTRECVLDVPFVYLQVQTFKAEVAKMGLADLMRNDSFGRISISETLMKGYAEIELCGLYGVDLLHSVGGEWTLSLEFKYPGKVVMVYVEV